jgi:DNA-damage-inducible protein J
LAQLFDCHFFNSSAKKAIWATMHLKFQRETAMTANTVVRARIDEHIKEEASIVPAKPLPFEALVPNAVTIAAVKQARIGGLKSFDSVATLMADLNSDN